MKGKQEQSVRWLPVALGLFALALLGVLSLCLWRQVDRLHRLHTAEDELTPLVAYQQERNAQLQQQLAHVSSADYPEEWARVEGGMTREGEVRLIVATPAPTTTPAPPPAAPPSLSFWERIEQWLFGSP